MKIKLLLCLIAFSITKFYAQTLISMPSGTTIVSASGSASQWARTGGDVFTISNSNWSTYTNCIYYGYPTTLAGVINGNTNNCASGLQSLSYNSGLSNLTGGILVYTGSTNYIYATMGSYSVNVRLTIKITNTSGGALSLVNTGSLNLLKITQNFKAEYKLESLNPFTGTYMGAINVFDYNSNSNGNMICSSLTHSDKFYQVTTTATAVNFGPYCASTPVRIKTTGGVSYVWSGPNSFTSYSNDTSFYAFGFPYLSRFKVTATGALGCKDSLTTVVTIKDTGTKIKMIGNSNPITDGATSTSLSNNTDFGGVQVGNSITKSFSITNPGTAPLIISAITIGGTNASMFVRSGITIPKTIAPLGNASFNVTYSPSTLGYKSANITLVNTSCNNGNYVYNIDGNTSSCDSTNIIARAAGNYKSKIVQTSLGGWTCYCDSTGKLLLSLKLGGTGAIIPDSGITMKIASTLAQYYPKNTGFIKADSGFVIWNRTWNVQPTTQPTSKVPVRYFYTQSMVDSINQVLLNKGQLALPNNDSLYFWKVKNPLLPAHPAIGTIFKSDINLIQGGKNTTTDTTWKRGNFGTNEYAEFLVSSFSGGGGGAGSGGITPLPIEQIILKGLQNGHLVQLNWETDNNVFIKAFNIYRSNDGASFNKIGTITQNNILQNAKYYNFTDNTLFQNGNYYYKVEQLNFNNSIISSNKVIIPFNNSSNTSINVWPNPATKNLNIAISNPDNQSYQIEIIDALGKTVSKGTMNNAWMDYNVNDLKNGIYQLIIRNEQGLIVESTNFMKLGSN